MDEYALRAMLAAEFEAAMGSLQASKLISERSDALDYYFGHMAKDMPAQDGRSQAVSYDVADTIEGLMPPLMEIFAGSDDVVEFDPVGPEDVEAAQQETDYVNHVFMNENPGFMVLYNFVKDALLSKVGIVKVFWDQREKEEKETYYDQPDDAYGLIVGSPDVEIVEHSERDDPLNPGGKLHDVTVAKKRDYSQAAVMNVPPEEWGIERGARQLRDCNYCYHRLLRPEQRLIEQGYDAEQVRALPVYRAYTNIEEISRDTVDEHQFYDSDVNPAVKLKQVIEHYVRMDYEGDGVARLYRVTTSSATGEILYLDGKLDIQEWDEIPFAVMTPLPVPHRFFGRSVADLTMDIQRIKTAMTRGMLDNVYLALNPRPVVNYQGADVTTLDDLLVSRPGAPIRTKLPAAIEWQEIPNIAPAVLPTLEYFDTLREWRTGVTRAGQGIDADALQNQSATAVNQVYSVSQARIKLFARIFAETGIRDMFYLLHGLIRKHSDKARTIRLRNQWVTVDPRNWKTRNDMTIHVGTGSGGRAQRIAEVSMIGNAQEKLLQGGYTNVVTPQHLYNTAKLLTRAVGEKDVDAFFADPSKQPQGGDQHPQAQQDPKIIQLQMQAQLQQEKQQGEMQLQAAQFQKDAALAQQKFEQDKELALLDEGRKREAHALDMQMKQQDMIHKQQMHEHNVAAFLMKQQEQKESNGRSKAR